MSNYANSIERLLKIMTQLRTQCPWDKKQTIASLRPQTVEELYELTDAIDREDWQDIKEELGDMLLHIVFYSKIASEEGHFSFDDVVRTVCDKLVHRHPHIYDHIQVNNDEDVKRNWEQIKKKENNRSVLSGVPASMPPMERAISIQKKVRQVGFDWDNKQQVWDKLQEELAELQQAETSEDPNAVIDEMGDVFFSMINYARYIGVDPLVALDRCNQRFVQRFTLVEQAAAERQQLLQDMNIEQLEVLWQEAKESLAKDL